MYATAIVRSARSVAAKRTFSTAIKAMAAGDTGAGAGRVAGGDAFSKREKANEDMFVREQEKQKLLALKERLKTQRNHIDELDKHIDDLVKGQGGEQN